jgi:hypothetical protein
MSCIRRIQKIGVITTLPFIAVVATTWSNVARADAVVDWNVIAADAIATAIAAGRPGPAVGLDFAMVHAAVYDAVQAIDKRFKQYQTSIPGATGSSTAAAAKAAYDVLVNLFPAQSASLTTAYNDYLSKNGLMANNPGVAVGQQAAAGIISRRANDGRYPTNPPPFNGFTEIGSWRPTPSYLPGAPAAFSPMAVPWLGTVTPFAIRSPSQFRATPPPALTSARYKRDYDEVKALGSFSSTARTAAETGLAYFWSDNFLLLWNRGLRGIADAHVTNIGDSARLFALANMAIADAVTSAWDSKYHYCFWRPVTAIQEGENDGNSETTGDSNWQPLLNTPNYPDYTSGANNVTGAVTRSLELFFGTNRMNFTLTSTVPQAEPKALTYRRFSDAAEDVVDVRIMQGIHFRFADRAARRQGRQVANWIFKRYLRPIDE